MAENILEIKNLSLINVRIYSGTMCGGIAGEGGFLTNCFVSGSIVTQRESSAAAGGLVGDNGNLINCGSSCSITVGNGSNAGGLVGEYGTAINCFSSGKITCGDSTDYGAESAAGGLCGMYMDMYNCFASGSIAGGSGARVGSLVGVESDFATVENSYWNAESGAKAGIFMIQQTPKDPMTPSLEPTFKADPSVSKTSAFMKSNDFVALLNKFVTENNQKYENTLTTWKLESGLNGGYPVLSGLNLGGNSAPVVTNPEIIEVIAIPTAAKVLVNGKNIAFEAYNINDNNYFKLRDIASVLSGTEKQFEVGWDGAKNAISLTSGKKYTAVGGEMNVSGGTANKTATPSTASVYLDGKLIAVKAYTIGDNNYFKLRDLGSAINFGVTWDDAASTIRIDTATGYTP